MKRGIRCSLLVTVVMSAILSGGCIRAVRTGAAEGVNTVIAETVAAILTQMLQPVVGGD